MARGQFISFEGIDGSGKSTQIRKLADALTAQGHQVICTREPGGSPGAELIRALLVSGDPDRWSAQSELLLFTAARRDHLEKTILPALEAGKIVLCDRFADSSRVYQGATRGDLRGMVDALHDLMIATDPDITLIFDMEPQTALSRGLARQSGEDRFEDFGLPFQEKLRTGYQNLAQDYPERCHLIDASQTQDAVFEDVLSKLQGRV